MKHSTKYFIVYIMTTTSILITRLKMMLSSSLTKVESITK